MAVKEQRERMTEYMAGQLEASGLVRVVERSDRHVVVAENPDIVDYPGTIGVLAHSGGETVAGVAKQIRKNSASGIYTAHVFYKDGENFMVRLGRRGHIKDPRSLKRYNKEQIDSMLHLRGLEEAVMEWTGQGILAYFQPRTARLEEGTRIFEMGRVALDYIHLKRGDNGYGFAHDTISKDYRLPKELPAGNAPLGLAKGRNMSATLVPLERAVEMRQGVLL